MPRFEDLGNAGFRVAYDDNELMTGIVTHKGLPVPFVTSQTDTVTRQIGNIVGEKTLPAGYVTFADKPIKVGMNIFPGWSTPGGGPVSADPWSVIPDARKPLQDYYDEASQDVIDQQIRWMVDYGIDYVMIDWFFDTTTHDSTSSTLVPMLEHFIDGYIASQVVGKPKFCVVWAASTNASYLSNAGFQSAIQKFITYFSDPDYLKIDGKPVVGFLDIQTTYANISPAGIAGIQALFSAAKVTVASAGYPGLFVLAGCSTSAEYWQGQVNNAAFDGVFPLNAGQRNEVTTGNLSTSETTRYSHLLYRAYGAADSGFESWAQAWIESAAATAGKLVFAPVSAGYDSTPWSPYTRLHGFLTSGEFAEFLQKAREFIETNPTKTGGYLIIQSWNEWGEGSVCAPSLADGFTKLETIKRVLSC